MASTYCPECDAVIKVKEPQIGIKIRCHDCNVELEVVATDPLDVYFVYDDDWGEDWDDDDY
jgi:lysine biosynthesis protein LysW